MYDSEKGANDFKTLCRKRDFSTQTPNHFSTSATSYGRQARYCVVPLETKIDKVNNMKIVQNTIEIMLHYIDVGVL